MNINELNNINSINVEAALSEVIPGSGTEQEIIEKVYDGTITPLTNNFGDIIGISYDSHASTIEEDNIAAYAFSKKYALLPIVSWVCNALQLKSEGKTLQEALEVVNSKNEKMASKEELPESLDIAYEGDFNGYACTEDGVKSYLRNAYNHYLSRKHEAPTIEFAEDSIHVTNIHWGRKF